MNTTGKIQSTINDYFVKVFKDIEISDAEKNQLMGIYMISVYKLLIELLLTFKGNDKEFIKKINQFIDSNIVQLDAESREIFDKTVENQKNDILKKIIDITIEKVPQRIAAKIQANLSS